MNNLNSSDFSPISPNKLYSGKKFAANYAGEHVAGTEFVIGALFVTWGSLLITFLWGYWLVIF